MSTQPPNEIMLKLLVFATLFVGATDCIISVCNIAALSGIHLSSNKLRLAGKPMPYYSNSYSTFRCLLYTAGDTECNPGPDPTFTMRVMMMI